MYETLLLSRELRIWCAVDRPIRSLLPRRRPVAVPRAGGLDVVVGHIALLGVLLLRVGLVRVGDDDVPGVEEAGKEAET